MTAPPHQVAPTDPDVALGIVLSELHRLHQGMDALPFQHAIAELEEELARARRELCLRLADDEGPRSGVLRVLRRLDLAFRRVADLLAEGRLRSEQRRALERTADLLRAVQGYARAHFLNGRA